MDMSEGKDGGQTMFCFDSGGANTAAITNIHRSRIVTKTDLPRHAVLREDPVNHGWIIEGIAKDGSCPDGKGFRV